jgi:hypothetical protein
MKRGGAPAYEVSFFLDRTKEVLARAAADISGSVRTSRGATPLIAFLTSAPSSRAVSARSRSETGVTSLLRWVGSIQLALGEILATDRG